MVGSCRSDKIEQTIEVGELQIQPVIQLKYQGPVTIFQKRVTEVIIGINNKQITHRFEPPLKAAVDIDILLLCIVLYKCGPENTVTEIDLYPRGNEK